MSIHAPRPWAIGRRLQYGIGFSLVWVLVGVYVYFANYYQPPTCYDEIMNGNESGVDCGGTCVRICAAEVLPPLVVWADSFRIADGQYNAVAYVDNQNQVAATPSLEYTFELYDRYGELIATRSGTTVLPPNSVYPIFEGKILVDSDEPVKETKITLKSADLWVPASLDRSQFRTVEFTLINSDARPRLDVRMENTQLTDAEDVEVVATIFNEAGEPVTVSRTLVESIPARSTEDIVFTWPTSIARTVKNCVIPTDVVVGIDLSGSMNNDGGTPPQPVSAALQAAEQFVGNLHENDQVGVVTFATNAELVTGLTSAHNSVSNTILGLTIDPESETGYTNTMEALQKAWNELNSNRHNPNARRVLVLLTDGLPTASGDVDVITPTEDTAAVLDEDGVEVYAIGLGSNVDQNFIRNIASSETNAYFAPSGSDLERIYAEITSSLCEVGSTKVDIIAKTKTNFASP